MFTIFAYLVGSIPVGLLVSYAWAGIDIRDYGSGNIGMTNVLRTLRPTHGDLPWVMTLALDFAKGYLPVYLALIWLGRGQGGEIPQIYSTYVAMVALAVMLGNFYPIYVSFRGGKGVATGLGVFSALMGFYIFIPLGVFVLLLLITRMVSVGSMAAVIAMPVTFYFMGRNQLGLFRPEHIPATPGIFIGLTVLIGLVVLFKHRGNIRRIVKGTEPRLWSYKSATPAAEKPGAQAAGQPVEPPEAETSEEPEADQDAE